MAAASDTFVTRLIGIQSCSGDRREWAIQKKKKYQKGTTSMTVRSNKWKMFNGSNHLIFGTVNLMRQ